MPEEKEDVILPEVKEPNVLFKSESDRKVCVVVSPEVSDPLIEISGYDLQINFNMKYLNSIADIESACAGVSELFKKLIMEELLKRANNQNH